VDFHADPGCVLWWEVERFNEGAQSFNSVVSEFKPPHAGVLRLAFPPGRFRLRVTFLNRVIAKPAEIEIEVQDGRIIPVRVTLTAAGVVYVRTEQESRGGTAKGRYGRRTRFGSDESVSYSVSAVAASPVTYQPKARMSYAR
jgi:hypothetical protein